MNRLNSRTARRTQDQQGFILLTALVFIIVLTVIVISTVNVSSSDEKIARNSRDKDVAFAAAEAAIRDAELYVQGSYVYPYVPNSNPTNYTSACTNALCDLRAAPLVTPIDQIDFYSTTDPVGSQSNIIGTTTGSPTINGLSNSVVRALNAQPRYLVEVVDDYSDPSTPGYVFRITAQAQGRSSNTRVTVQELYKP
jgi:type IV pilus assembly protein PilX